MKSAYLELLDRLHFLVSKESDKGAIDIDMAPLLSHRVFTLESAYAGTPSIKEA